MTLVWFIVWLVANTIGDSEPLLFDPVNWWAGTLILAVALDLGRQHASGVRPTKKHDEAQESR
jgi:hypothetical protein